MNDNSYTDAVFEPVELKKPSDRPKPPIRDKKRRRAGDLMLSILPILSALILLFSVILTLTVALINADFTPKPQDDHPAGVTPDEQPIADYMAHPRLPSFNTVAESNAYIPSGSGAAISDSLKLGTKSAILVELDGMTVVAGRAVDQKLPIASMTKVMTLLVCLDYITEAGEDAFYDIISLENDPTRLVNYQCWFIKKSITNHRVRVYVLDALYGLILQSGADCAYGLAEHFAGSETEFVKKMNEKAAALGMTSTTFTNCVGKDDADADGKARNISSVRDVATMFIYALQNDMAETILSAPRWVCVGRYDNDKQTIKSLVLSEDNKELNCGAVTVMGGKSGKEDIAKRCLVTVGKTSDGRKFVCVVAGAGSSYDASAAIYRNFVS